MFLKFFFCLKKSLYSGEPVLFVMAKAKPSTLQKYRSTLTWQDLPADDLPLGQGLALKEVIERYEIPARRVGYGQTSIIGVETNNQIMYWRDHGSHLEFKGIVNKDGSAR